MNRLVDYSGLMKSLEYDYRTSWGEQFVGKRKPTMGTFRQEFLTPLGARVLDQARRFHGRLPKFRGACREGMYLKFEVRSWDEYHALTVFRDWLLDEGIGVTLTESEREVKTERYRWDKKRQQPVVTKLPPEPEGGNRYLKFDLR